MSQPPLLDIQNLVKRFGALLATDHVSLQVLPNEIHALIGPNGAGKTSLVAQLSAYWPVTAATLCFRVKTSRPCPPMSVFILVWRALFKSRACSNPLPS